jgi:hypothetical protein
MMLSLTLVSLSFPLILVVAGIVLLLALVNALGVLFGLLWPTLLILVGLTLVWRLLRGGRR